MKDGTSEVQAAIDEIEDALADLLECGDRCRRPVSRILRNLKHLKHFLAAQTGSEFSARSGAEFVPRRTRKQPKKYAVRLVGGRETLAEFRAGGQNPFYCPREVLDAVAKSLAAGVRPMSFDEIMAGVTRQLDSRPADFLVRVCLRFLTDPTVQLVTRDRARYRAIRPRALPRSVGQQWSTLGSPS